MLPLQLLVPLFSQGQRQTAVFTAGSLVPSTVPDSHVAAVNIVEWMDPNLSKESWLCDTIIVGLVNS